MVDYFESPWSQAADQGLIGGSGGFKCYWCGICYAENRRHKDYRTNICQECGEKIQRILGEARIKKMLRKLSTVKKEFESGLAMSKCENCDQYSHNYTFSNGLCPACFYRRHNRFSPKISTDLPKEIKRIRQIKKEIWRIIGDRIPRRVVLNFLPLGSDH